MVQPATNIYYQNVSGLSRDKAKGKTMPKKLEAKLKKEARKKFGTTTSPRARKYIYGTMRKAGWTPKK